MLVAMLPIFLIGLAMGIIISYIWCLYEKDVPSEAKIHIQEAEIIRYKNDLEMYHKLMDKLYKEISELKSELENKK